MIDSKYSRHAVSLLAFLPMVLCGQKVHENAVPLKNWATPLYWQPNQVETAAPQLVFSANQVSTNALTFIAITPCRLVDTRGASAGFNGISPFSGPSIPALGTITIPVQSPTEAMTNTTPAPCGVIPTIAQAYSFNLTVVPSVSGTAVDYVSLWPAGGTQPFVSTLDDPQGAIVSNAAIVPAGPTSSPGYGGVSVYNDGPATTDIIIDMNGYFAAPTDVNFNTAIGAGTLASNTTGNANTATGWEALVSNTTGNQNTATGAGALAANTTGGDNTATGVGALGANTTGIGNTAVGDAALVDNTTGSYNTASGASALQDNTTGSQNTASGQGALQDNTTGNNNTASGFSALNNNTTGANNTALGQDALQSNTTGNYNTASGQAALQLNTTGQLNTASGYQTLQANTIGGFNTASGGNALLNNTTGGYNTASGAGALNNNTTGAGNTASGESALADNITGNYNTASGYSALEINTTGSFNIAIGYEASSRVANGNSNNIDIGSVGASGDGATANNGVIRIGTEGTQTSAYIAGISGASVSGGAAVYVASSGQLGTVLSSQRFKEQITDMGETSSKLLQLRPVNFFYKPQYDDGSHLLQYGLIAEEVAKVYPEMVAYDNDGQILTVKYQLLAPMLLNEVQKLEQRVAALEALLSVNH